MRLDCDLSGVKNANNWEGIWPAIELVCGVMLNLEKEEKLKFIHVIQSHDKKVQTDIQVLIESLDFPDQSDESSYEEYKKTMI